MRPSRFSHGRALEQDRVLDLRALDHAVPTDRGVRPDVRVAHDRAGADDRRAAHARAFQPCAGLDDDAAVDLRLVEVAVDPALDGVEDQPVGLEHVVQAAGVLPPAAHDVRLDALAVVHQPLDRVGDLQLAALGRLDRPRGLVDHRREHVDAHQREVGRGLGRLLDQPHHAPVDAELGDAVVLRVGHLREQDQRLGRLRAEVLDELLHPALQQVVAEVHHERRAAQERLGREHGVSEAGGLVLHDVADPHAELAAVAGGLADLVAGLRRDDDPDVADARGGHRLDAVEQHRLVRHRHELLRRGERDRPQPGPPAARQDEALELLHRACSLEEWPVGADVERTVAAPAVSAAGEAGTLSSLRALLDVAALVHSRDDLPAPARGDGGDGLARRRLRGRGGQRLPPGVGRLRGDARDRRRRPRRAPR